MNNHVIKIVDILNNHKELITDAFIRMLTHKQECVQNQIVFRSKILFASLIGLLCNLKKGNCNNKLYTDVIFYRKVFYYIFCNISYVRSKKSIIKKIYILINTIKKECEIKIKTQLCSKHNNSYVTSDSYNSTDSSDSFGSIKSQTITKDTNTTKLSYTNSIETNTKFSSNSTSNQTNKIINLVKNEYNTNKESNTSSCPISETQSKNCNEKCLRTYNSCSVNKLVSDIDKCKEISLDNSKNLENSYKVLGLLKILLVVLEKDISHLQMQLNLKEPSENTNIYDIDFINRLLCIFFSQYLTIITKHSNLFITNEKTNIYNIKINNEYLTVCILDNLYISEELINNKKCIVISTGKNKSYIYYIESPITNDEFYNLLNKNLENLSITLGIININYKLLESCLTKLNELTPLKI